MGPKLAVLAACLAAATTAAAADTSDAWITTKTKIALLTSDDVSGLDQAALEADDSLNGISVGSVDAGVVVLEGEAESLRAVLRAVEAANRVRGVRRVASEIAVEGEPRP